MTSPSRPFLHSRTAALALCWLIAAVLVLVPQRARAIEYEVFIDVETEEELYDLVLTGEISQETFDTLLDIYRRGVDLNTASRQELYALPNLTYDDVDAILEYREESGALTEPAVLVVNGILSERKLQSIAMFIVVVEPGRRLSATNGFVRYQTAWTPLDGRVPPMAIQARINTLRNLTVGMAAVLPRNRLGPVGWDENRQAMTALPASPIPQIPKFYAMWDQSSWGVIAGTYRVGFGQRLTFDNSGRYTPNGFFLDDALFWSTDLVTGCRQAAGELAESPCAGEAGDRYVTPDWRWRDTLQGAAIGVHHLELPTGWMQAYGFFSYQNKDIYQYELYDREACANPRDDNDEQCRAPEVWVTQDDPLDPAPRWTFQTLPDIYTEVTGGGNIAYFYKRRIHVGATGYGSGITWRVPNADLDFQEWSRTPFGGPFGAVGLDAAWGHRWADIFLEVTRSFDSMAQDGPEPSKGGGFAALLRHTATWTSKAAQNEFEVAARYYDTGFANPYSRGISAPDEFEGLRSRDEAGIRIRYNGLIMERLNIRSLLDVWGQQSVGAPKLQAYLRGDYQVVDWFRPGAWFAYQNRDMRTFDGSSCYDVSVEFDENGEPIPCAGERYQGTLRFRFDPLRKLSISTQYQHNFVDDPDYGESAIPDLEPGEVIPPRFRQDLSAWLIVNIKPFSGFRVRVRGRYLFQEIQDNTSLEQSFWTYVDINYRWRWILARVRYDLRFFLDDRANTQARIPNPENWLRFELEARF